MRPPDDGPTTPVKITPEDFHRAAETFLDGSKGMFRIRDQLWDGLAPAAGWAGVDKQALEFGAKFSAALSPVMVGFIAASMVLGDIAEGIDESAYNHWRADQAATPGGGVPDPPWQPIFVGLTLNPHPMPFPMTGNATHRLPDYLQSIVPLGDQNMLWAAAQTFFDLRDDLDGISAGLRGTLQNLFANNVSSDLTALDEFWDRVGGLNNDKAILTALRDGCDRLGQALYDYATWMKDTKDQIEDAVIQVIKDAAFGALVGILLAAISDGIAGLGDLFVALDAAGEGGAVLGAVTGVLGAENVAGHLAAVVGSAGAVYGVMNAAIEQTPIPNLGQSTDPAAVTDEQLEAEAADLGDLADSGLSREGYEKAVTDLQADSPDNVALTRPAAEHMLDGPPGTTPEVGGPGQKGADILFKDQNGNVVLKREAKTLEGGANSFSSELSTLPKQFAQTGGKAPAEACFQVKAGTTEEDVYDMMRQAQQNRLGNGSALSPKYDGIKISFVDEDGNILGAFDATSVLPPR